MAEGARVGRIDLTPLVSFDPLSDPTSLGQRWKAWKRRFEIYVVAQNITDGARKRALLLYQVGQATQEIFDTIPDTGDDYDTAINKLDGYFSPKKNLDYEVFKFRTTTQNVGETVDQYVTRLRRMAPNCEFPDLNRELKSTVIQNCTSKRLRRIALRDDLSLDALLAKARSMEVSETQASGIEKLTSLEKVTVNHVKAKHFPKQTPKQTSETQCRKCGLASWPHKDGPCPAQGKTCSKCGKANHFARMCLTKQAKPQHYKPRPAQHKFTPKPKSHVRQVHMNSVLSQVTAVETSTSTRLVSKHTLRLQQSQCWSTMFQYE